MLIKTHTDGRVIGPAEMGCGGHHFAFLASGQVLREPQLGRVVRGPSLHLQQPVESLGERHWVTRTRSDGRVVPREWLIDPTDSPRLMTVQVVEPFQLERPREASATPKPTRAA